MGRGTKFCLLSLNDRSVYISLDQRGSWWLNLSNGSILSSNIYHPFPISSRQTSDSSSRPHSQMDALPIDNIRLWLFISSCQGDKKGENEQQKDSLKGKYHQGRKLGNKPYCSLLRRRNGLAFYHQGEANSWGTETFK